MMKRTFSILLVFCLLFTLSAPALAVSDNGNNSTISTAQAVALGDTISGAISIKGDVDFYRLTVTESGCLTLDVISYLEWYSLLLYDTEGERVWKEEYKKWNDEIQFRTDIFQLYLEEGTYYLQVKGSKYSDWGSDYTGNYSIETAFESANATETELNNSIGQADSFSPGSTIRGILAQNGDVDFYQFTINESGCLTLDVTSYLEWYSLLLYNTAGETIWTADYKNWDDNIGFRTDTFQLYLEAGEYYLQVKGSKYSDWGSEFPGEYTIGTAFEAANATEKEPNDGIGTAQEVRLGDTVRGVIDIEKDVDFYKFTIEKVGKMKLHVTSYLEFYSLVLYDEYGTSVWDKGYNPWDSSTGSRKDVHEIALEPGNYYLQVKGSKYSDWASDHAGVYSLSFGGDSFQQPEEPEEGSGDEPEKPAGFLDVPSGSYYSDAVAWAVENSVAFGTGAMKFSPEQGCTRAQIVTFLWRAAGQPKPVSVSNRFRDVSENSYYYDAVLWAVENGITTGDSADTFSPEKVCTRAQAVTFQWRAAGKPSASGSSFHDVSPAAYYADAVRWAVANGIAYGTGGNRFSPNAACTRAQIVTFLYRDLA